MNKITKIILTIVTIVLATNLVVVNVEAAKKAKEYKATAKYLETEGTISFKKGEAIFANGGTLSVIAPVDTTIYCNFKSGTTKISKVKTPTMISKKAKFLKSIDINIKKDTVVKFKVVKGKVTKSKFKKAKTYYFVCKVQKTPFVKQQTTLEIFDKVTTVNIPVDNVACDKIVYTVNSGKKCVESLKDYSHLGMSFTITKPTTIKVTGYKLGKKLGTYTYKYDVQKYTPNKMHDYKLKGEFPSQDYCHYAFYLPYGDGFVFSYTLDGSTPTLTNGTLVESVTDKDLDYYKRGYEVKSPVDGNVTLKVQYYKKAYIKEGNKYVFDSYQPYGNILGGRYVGITTNGTFSVLSDGALCATESYKDTYNFKDYQCTKNLDYALVTWLDNKGYIRTKKLMPGERISEYSDWGALEIVGLIAVKDGKPSVEYKNQKLFEKFHFGYRDEFLTFDLLLASYEVYEKELPETEFPRLTPDQTYADSSQCKAGVGLSKGYGDEAVWIVD